MQTVRGDARRNSSARRLVGLVAVFSLFASACGGSGSDAPGAEPGGAELPSTTDWDAVLEGAAEEGELVVFASQPGTEAWEASFEDAYPDIDLTVERIPTGDQISRIDQATEAGEPSADIAYNANPQWFEERGEQGLVAPFPEVPAMEAWPEEALGEYTLDALVVPYGMMWNTEIGKPVENMREFFDVVGNEGVGINTPDNAQVVADAIQVYEDSFEGEEFWERLTDVNAQIMDGSVAAQAVAAGELAYAFPTQAGIPQELADEGAPVEWGLMDEISGYTYTTGIVANAAHPNAALVFMDWLMQESTIDGMIKDFAQGATAYIDVPSASVPASEVPITDLGEWPQERWDGLVAKLQDAVQ
jgi:iron(III) transport system substrate-binding protein